MQVSLEQAFPYIPGYEWMSFLQTAIHYST